MPPKPRGRPQAPRTAPGPTAAVAVALTVRAASRQAPRPAHSQQGKVKKAEKQHNYNPYTLTIWGDSNSRMAMLGHSEQGRIRVVGK